MYSSSKKSERGNGLRGDGPKRETRPSTSSERCCAPAESRDGDRERQGQGRTGRTRSVKEIVQFYLGRGHQASGDTHSSTNKSKLQRASPYRDTFNPRNAPKKTTGKDTCPSTANSSRQRQRHTRESGTRSRENVLYWETESLEQARREREEQEDRRREKREKEERDREERERERQVQREKEKREERSTQRRETEERERKEERKSKEKKMRGEEKERQKTSEQTEEERQRKREERGRQRRQRKEREKQELERKEKDKRQSRRRENQERRRKAAALSRIHLGWLHTLKESLTESIEVNVMQERYLLRSGDRRKKAEIQRLRDSRRKQVEIQQELEEKVTEEKKKQQLGERKKKTMTKKRRD